MKMLKISNKKSAQEMQDEIFKRMSVDEKIELGVQLWRLAKELDSSKIDYGRRTNRPARPPHKGGANS